MELQEFVSSSLIQIIRGVSEASAELKGSGAVISPKSIYSSSADRRADGVLGKYMPGSGDHCVFQVAFDVAVGVTEGTKTKAGIGGVIGIVALGAKGESDSSESSTSRLKFTVPVVFPPGDDEHDAVMAKEYSKSIL